MFSKDNPARDINELVEYLEETHDKNIVYRGQSKDYDTLVPSFYRNKLSSTRYEASTNTTLHQFDRFNHFIQFDFSKASEVDIAKRIAMNHLMAEFGKSLGNVLSQQYGINSECLDVTSDPHVAAFFATHNWPEYKAVVESSHLGIIYRIHSMANTANDEASILQHAGIEVALSAHYLQNDMFPIPFLFSSTRNQFSEEEFEELNQKYHFVVEKTMSRPIVLNESQLQEIIYTFFQNKYPEIDIKSKYEGTRIFKQKAGFFIPSFGFNSFVPSDKKLANVKGVLAYSPGFVIDKEKVLIEDILAFPRVEKYYFRHNAAVKSTYTREELWPSKDDDFFFNLLYRWCSDGCREYLRRLQINIDDRERGILDRGYYDLSMSDSTKH